MVLVIAWIIFILFIIFSKDVLQFRYLLFSICMFCFTYYYNKISPFILTLRKAIVLLSIPHIVFWHIAFVYNDFLCLNPISYELFLTFLFTYIYVLIYVFTEH